MKFLLTVGVFLVLISVFVFAIGFEVGGGITNIGILGVGLNLPTVTAGLNVPILDGLSVTGNFGVLFEPSTTNISSVNSQMIFLATGGVRYTFGDKSSTFKPFVGMDGGLLFGDLSSVSESYFVFGP
ncbi:MAG: hypothetical protein ACP5G8_08525, partial [Athalassotoga sp.]